MVANPITKPIPPESAAAEAAVEIRVKGTVQGVGFRPTVYQLAIAHDLRGEVYNDAAGVLIRVAGTASQIAQFVERLRLDAPPLAKVESVEVGAIAPTTVPQTVFEITPSRSGQSQTQIAPDAATCPQCLADSLDPDCRFYRYPFTNCTHCGPRLSIVRAIPYDRDRTSMATFPMCPACREEYDDPLNRRFHAQPVACHRCGPRAWLERADGRPVVADLFSRLDDVDAVCTLLQRGEIVAIKGLGGIHLACDATNEAAVSQLRQRKRRYHKPFALMVRDLSVIAPYCEVDEGERSLLESAAAPIVLLQRRTSPMVGSESSQTLPPIAPSVAPHLPTLGVMLPNTPLHHLMLKRMGRPIVLTSGNLSDEPQCIDNDTAREKLGQIATYFLLHNREIVNRVDDSVVRVVAGQRQTLRRARGYAPAPIRLPDGFEKMPPILAMGGELKSTFCLARSGEAILSQHLGDLENATAFAAYQDTLALYQQLFEPGAIAQKSPWGAIAADLHPDYLATKLGHQLAQEGDLPLYGIQHHHAHIAACMVEHGLPIHTPAVLGIALDGLGYGADSTLWGGEFLLADYRGFRRLAHFEPMAMLGGAQAARQPWRNTYAQLMAALGWEALTERCGDLELVQFLATRPRPVLDQMLATQMGSPLASSAGRLFDAVAAAVGCCREAASYEGQGAIELEALVQPDTLWDESCGEPYPMAIAQPHQTPILSAAPLWPALLQDLQRGVEKSVIAARFHQGLAIAVAQLAADLAERHPLTQVVLSGGVFQNQVLLVAVTERLRQRGLTVLTPHEVPPNDGGLSLGQVAIAAAQTL
ncbi:MAG: carbamoyltransferase HypF [Synechococcales bacterium]|nr:carbamoyltransferase HypF [Synechococcales bacterium]